MTNLIFEQQTSGKAHMAFTMALVSACGGAAGYVKKKSIASGVAGVTCGGLFALAGYLIDQGKSETGIPLAASTSVLLCGAMSYRLLKTKKLFPAGIVAGVSGFSAGYYVLAWTKQT